MSDANPTVSVILVSYNTRDLTLRCLRALYAGLGGVAAEVWLVDNASADGSAAAVREQFPGVKVIANEQNVGFGAANNQAMAAARGAYFLLLNTDAFVEPGAVAALVAHLESHPKVGAAGPRLLNADGSLQRSCFPFPTPGRAWLENLWLSAALPDHPVVGDYRRWPHDAERDVAWVIGACLMVRREVYERVGGFDEQFFMYSEEADWQRRIRDAGWAVAFTPAARATHLGGASGASERVKINRHFFDSCDRYVWKHHGAAGLVSFRAAMVVGCAARAVLWAGVLAAVPSRRAAAAAKTRLLTWLVVRQLTHWRLPGGGGSRTTPVGAG